ncbi:MAG: DUF6273 domain-containing protein [Acholeplasmatales bacterium]|nr:DUF6273 domain-containing protein [Acholeplasmatales bacterium]
MKLIRKILLLVGVMVLSSMLLVACSSSTKDDKDSDITGTYYLYEEDQLDKDSYYIITSSSWTDENNDSGIYKLNGTTIIFYMSESGNEELYRGTIGDGKLEITFEGIKTTYYKEGSEPSDDEVYYTVTFKDYDGTVLQTSSVKKGETPAYSKSNPPRENDDNYSYTFSGWQPTLTEVSEDAIYTATYTSQSLPYYVTIDLDGGTSSATKLQFKTDKISKDMLPLDVKKSGFVFKGYSLNDVKVYDENGNVVSNYQPSANMTFKAIYEESVTLTVFYTLYNPKTGQLIETFNEKPTDMGNVSETRSYNYNTYVDLLAYANEGYTFVGWYNDGQVLSNEKDYKYMMWNEDFTIEARFRYTLYDLTVWSNNTDLGQVMIRSGNSQVFYNEETLQEHYTESVTIVAYSKTDTRFLGWYDEKNELVSTNAVYTFDMLNRDYTLEAKWNSFDITYDLDGGVNNSSNPTNYNVDTQNITLFAPTKDGYTFQGWQYKGTVITQINTANICHMNLKALWTANTNTPYKVEHYLQNIDNDNYTLYETDNLTGTTDTETAGSVKTYEGFTSPSITQVNIDGNGNTIIKLYYTRNSYIVTLNKDIDKAGTITGAGTYKYGKEVTITAKTNEGYTFIGWYKNDKLYIEDASFDYTIGAEAVVFETRYTTNKYTITIDNQVEGVTISGITSGNQYDFDSQIALTATNIPSGCTIKWIRSDDVVKGGDTYTFKVPAGNITITITTTTSIYTREGNKIYFGTYPQTKVTATTENGLLSITFDSSTWTSYRYYISGSQSDFMYYKDVDIDNNGTYDYRGVYFTQYRSEYTSSGGTYQDDNGYSTNTIYWFSYDPIEWDILTESNGKALIIANLILDSQDYYPSSSTSSFSHNGGTGYANNYELSAIRKFLNDNFYNMAFNDLQKALIETTTVDNSAASTGQSSNSYECNNTNDKMFLLSYKEATKYYTSTIARRAGGSDYAKCQGLWENGFSFWWLRSPYGNYAHEAYYVDDKGVVGRLNVFFTCVGVRPTCWITL